MVLAVNTTANTYSVNTNKASVIGDVYRITTLSIAPQHSEVNEGGELKFIVTSNHNPRGTINDVKYRLTEENTSFRHASLTSGAESMMDLTFIQVPPSTDWTASIPIQLRNVDNINTINGTINLELIQPATNPNYLVASSPKDEASATIRDVDTLEISITNANATFNGENAEFAITTETESNRTHTIKIKATNGTGNFLDETDGTSGMIREIENVSFTRTESDQPYSYTLEIPTKIDNTSASDTIEVELVDDSTTNSYNLDANNDSATVRVYRIQTLSIAPPNSEAEVNEGAELKFVVTSDFKPANAQNSFTINYMVSETSNYRATSVMLGTPIEITLVFEEDPMTKEWTSEIPVALRDADNIDAENGEISVALAQPDVDANYVIASASDENTATTTILDIDTPEFSIDNGAVTFNGDNAQFLLTSDIQSTQSHTIKVTPTNKRGNFLEETASASGVSRPIANVNFVYSMTDQTSTYTLELPTKIDNDSTSGEIEVILAENSDSDTYTVDSNENTATVIVYRIPTLSITPPNSEAKVNEGAELKFIVTADFRPPNSQNSLSINYTVAESSEYRATSVVTGSPIPTSLIFQQDPTTKEWTSEIPILLRNQDNISTGNGEITVSLVQPGANPSYQVTTSLNKNSATTTIVDLDTPKISISNAAVIINGENAQFTITSHVLSNIAHSIKYRPTNTRGSFLDETTNASGEPRTIDNVRFSTTQPYTYSFTLGTRIDSSSVSGEIEIELLTNSDANTYNVDTDDDTGSVTVYRLPTLSIDPPNIDAQVNEGAELKFKVTSDYRPPNTQNSVSFSYTITESSNYRSTAVVTGTPTPITLIFQQDQTTKQWVSEIPVNLRNVDNIDAENGEVTITLDPPGADAGYAISNMSDENSASTTILDVDIPEFSIENATATFNGEEAQFNIISDIQTTQLHSIKVIPTNTINNFLNEVDGLSGDSRLINNLQFGTTSPYSTTIAIRTKVNSSVVTGEIEVELVTNSDANTYNVHASDNTATVTVYRLPTLSIAPPNSEAQVNEGVNFNFIVTSNFKPPNPQNSLDVSYTISESSNYRASSVTTGFQSPTPLIFQQNQTTKKWTAEIPIELRNPDNIDSATGVITVALFSPITNSTHLIANESENYIASVTIADVDVPEFSINDAPTVHNGNDAQFTLFSDIITTQPHSIMLTPTSKIGNFLNETESTSGNSRKINNVRFSRTQPYTATISIPTKIDNTAITGEIEVELTENSEANTYNIDTTKKTANVTIYRITTLSIAPPNTAAQVNEGSQLNFIVTADFRPPNLQNSLSINYTVSETSGYRADSVVTGVPTPIRLVFRQNQNSQKWNSEIPISLRNANNIDAENGEITVSLVAPISDSSHRVSNLTEEISASAEILDIDIPEFSINNAATVFNGIDAEFTINSTIKTTQSHTIKIIPTNNNGNFLDETASTSGTSRLIENIRFSDSQPYHSTFSIPTKIDETSSSDNINIELVTNSDTDTYNVDTEKNIASVTVYRLQTLSITPPNTEFQVNEGTELKFIVISDYQPPNPQTSLSITYTVSESSNYRASSVVTGTSLPIDLTFQQNPTTQEWYAEIPILLRNRDNISTENGNISVTLDQPGANPNYLVDTASNNNSATTTIIDLDTPTISIEDANPTLNGENALFTIASNIQSNLTHAIKIRATNTSGDFLAPGAEEAGTPQFINNVNFANSHPYNFTFTIQTQNDISTSSGEIQIELLENAEANTYNIHPNNNTASVLVYNIPTLSISPPNSDAEINEGAELNFKVISDFKPLNAQNTIDISYTIAETSDYRATTVVTDTSIPITLTFLRDPTTNQWISELPINLRAVDNIDAVNGAITVALDQPSADANHLIAATSDANSATTTILDVDVPEFSIETANAIYQGDTAQFEISSDIQSTQSHIIKVTSTNLNGNFLDETTNKSGEAKLIQNVTFSYSKTEQTNTYNLEIHTAVDSNSSSGEIEVEIMVNSESHTYNVDSNKSSASVAVYRIPTLSIYPPNSEAQVDEGGELKFIVFADFIPPNFQNRVEINYSVSESKNYLASSVNTGVSIPATLIFQQDPTTKEWSSEIPISLRDADNINAENGEITVTLETPATDISHQVASATNQDSATTTILEVDIPTLSIEDSAPTYNGEDTQFTLTSDLESTISHSIEVIPSNTTGNFLDEIASTSGTSRTFNNIRFSRTQPYSVTISIPTKFDFYSTSGEIEVELIVNANSNTYHVDANDNTATVTVYRITTLSIAPPNPEAEVNEGTELNFIVTSNYKPPNAQNSLFVNYTVSELSNFRASAVKTETSNLINLVFQRNQTTNEWFAQIPISLREVDNINSNNGEISVTLDRPVGISNFQVAVTPQDYQATTTILDVNIPELSIENAGATYNGEDAQFTLVSDIESAVTHTITVIPTNTNGNFLDETNSKSGNSRSISAVRFNRTEQDQRFTTTISIPTKIDATTLSGEISIELNVNSQSNTYRVDEDNKTANVVVYRISQLTISPLIPEVNEGDELIFIVTANFKPPNQQNTLNLVYTVTEDNSNYLDTFLPTRTLLPANNLQFVKDSESTNWIARLPIPLRARDTQSTSDGMISVTLVQFIADADYKVSTAPAVVTIIEDSNPFFSINNAEPTYAGENAIFTLTSQVESTNTHIIEVIPKNTSGNFLDETAGNSETSRLIENVLFSTSSPHTATIQIPTIVDNTEPSGVIDVELVINEEANTYNVDTTKNTATVTVYSITTLSIAPENAEVDEGGELNFVVTANYNPRVPLTINYTVTEENSDFLSSSISSGMPLTIKDLVFTQETGATTWTANIPIQLRPIDTIVSENGSIKLLLNEPSADAGYLVAESPNNEATTTIRDANTPTIYISNARETIAGENLEFMLTANKEIKEEFSLMIKPTNTIGEFLNVDAGASGIIRTIDGVTFTRQNPEQPFTYTLIIPTRNDVDSSSGIISVDLVVDSETSQYLISANTTEQSATGTILNNNGNFTISIADASTPEGDEGMTTTLEFAINLSIALQFPITINYTLEAYEGTISPATKDSDFTFEGGSISFPAGDITKKISATIIGDNTFEPNEAFRISIAIVGDSQVMVTKSNGIGTIENDDEPERPVVSITTNQTNVTEGSPAIFTITAVRPQNDLTNISVSLQIIEQGSYIAWRIPRQRAIPAGETQAIISIFTINDSNDEDDGNITIEIQENTSRYSISLENPSASVGILDNDDVARTDEESPRISIAQTAVNSILGQLNLPPAEPLRAPESNSRLLPIVSVLAMNQSISEGDVAEFNIIANGHIVNTLVISFTISQNGDFLTSQLPTQVQIPKTKNQAKVFVNTLDDQIAETDGTITLQILPDNNYQTSTQNQTTIVVSDAVDRQIRKNEIASRSSEILPQYLELLGGNILTTTSQRIQQAQENTDSTALYRINGANGIKQIISTGGEMLNSEPESLRSMLGNSEFKFDVYAEDHLVNPISVWGLGELTDVTSSSNSSASNWQGDAFTGHLGFDTKLSHNILMGMSTSTVDLDSGYAKTEINEFLFQSRSTTFNPYLSWTSPNNDAHIYSIVSYGLGEINIKQPGYQYETLQSHASNLSFSGSKKLYASDSFLTGGTSELSLIGESWIANLQIAEKAGILDETSLSAQHHRVAVAGSHLKTFSNGSSLEPLLSVGLLHDGKDQATLRGVELRNAVSYSAPIGLELTSNARLIQEQMSQLKLWNIQGSFAYDYGRDQLGPMIEVSGTYSAAPSDYTNLLNMSIIDGVGTSSLKNSINTTFQYGLSVCGETCLVTPYVSYDFDVNGLEKSQHGAKLSVGSLFNLEFEHTYNPNSKESTNQRIQFNSKLNW